MAESVHAVAATGYGRAAETYARARPGYPPEAAPWLVTHLGTRELLEIGAGTGKLTRLLVAAGASVTAVEPVAAMRERLAGLDGVDVVAARAEELPLPDASVAGAVFSQSLHWTDAPAALAEVDRVLVPRGHVGLVWNFRDTSVPWQAELDRLLADLRGDAPHSRDGRWQAAVAASPFAVVDQVSWCWAHDSNVRGVVDRVLSVSYVAALDPADRGAVTTRVGELLASALGVRGDGDPVVFPYVTEAYVLARPPA
jgi:SAM-dependent methyltransferase